MDIGRRSVKYITIISANPHAKMNKKLRCVRYLSWFQCCKLTGSDIWPAMLYNSTDGENPITKLWLAFILPRFFPCVTDQNVQSFHVYVLGLCTSGTAPHISATRPMPLFVFHRWWDRTLVRQLWTLYTASSNFIRLMDAVQLDILTSTVQIIRTTRYAQSDIWALLFTISFRIILVLTQHIFIFLQLRLRCSFYMIMVNYYSNN